jgi:hypothetical protein
MRRAAWFIGASVSLGCSALAACSAFGGSDAVSHQGGNGGDAAANDDGNPMSAADASAVDAGDGGSDAYTVPLVPISCATLQPDSGMLVFCSDFDRSTGETTYTTYGLCTPVASSVHVVSMPSALDIAAAARANCSVVFGATVLSGTLWTVSFDVYLDAARLPAQTTFASLGIGIGTLELVFANGAVSVKGLPATASASGWTRVVVRNTGAPLVDVMVGGTHLPSNDLGTTGLDGLTLGASGAMTAAEVWFDDVLATSP